MSCFGGLIDTIVRQQLTFHFPGHFTAPCWYSAGILVCCQRNAPQVGRAANCCRVLQPRGWETGEFFLGRMTICWVFLKCTFFLLAAEPQYSSSWGPSYAALWEQDNISHIFLQRNKFKYVQWKLSIDFRDRPQLSIASIGPAVSCAQYTQTSLEVNVKVLFFFLMNQYCVCIIPLFKPAAKLTIK